MIETIIKIFFYFVNIVKTKAWVHLFISFLIGICIVLFFIIFFCLCKEDDLALYARAARNYETYLNYTVNRSFSAKVSNFCYNIISFFLPSFELNFKYLLVLRDTFIPYYGIYLSIFFFFFLLLFFIL